MSSIRPLSRSRPVIASIEDAADFVDLLRSILALFRQANEALAIPLSQKGAA